MTNQEERYEESKPKTFKFGAVGDFLKGTLLKIDRTTKPDTYGKLSYIYTVKSKEGLFYGSAKNEKTGKYILDNEQTTINDGEEYSVFLNVESIAAAKMKDGRAGQKFMIKFDELKPTDKGNDAKIIKVFWGKTADGAPLMDDQWLKENMTIDDL